MLALSNVPIKLKKQPATVKSGNTVPLIEKKVVKSENKPDLSKMTMAEQLQWNIEEMKRKNAAKKAKKEAAK